jgi:radical SAM protein with 4Fe4S-binding SPASM domain
MSYVEWLATNACNFRCAYCGVSAGQVGPDELNTEEALAMLGQLRACRVRRLLVTGGEPLLRSDLGQILSQADSLGIQTGLVTNGYLVQERWEDLAARRYFLCLTSLDGPPEVNDRLRGRAGAFQRALEALRLFASIGVPVRVVHTVVQPENIDYLETLFGDLRQAPVTLWQLSPVSLEGRACGKTNYALTGDQLRYLAGFTRRPTRGLRIEFGESRSYLSFLPGGPCGKPFFCGAGLTRCTILPNGDVAGCQPMHTAGAVEGNIRSEPLETVWRRGFHTYRDLRLPAHCSDCPVAAFCLGGCRAETVNQGGCLKGVWDDGRS